MCAVAVLPWPTRDAGIGTDLAIIHFPVAQLFHLCILGWHDANSDLRRSAEVRTIECNRRNRPTPQSLPGFLAQAPEESIFHDIASLSRCRSRALLLDHLVRNGLQRQRHREIERVGPALDRSGKRGLASDSTSSMQATNERLIRVSLPRSLFNAVITPHRGRRRNLPTAL